MDIAHYLERLRFTGDYAADRDTLYALHRAHMLTVPFENLDIPLKRPIILEEQALYHKVVEYRRGGFCYELNGLFAALLREIGFQVDFLSARVWTGRDFSQDFDHMALLVHLEDDQWLADVGFGDCFIEPLRFVANQEQTIRDVIYRLLPLDDRWLLQSRKPGEEWENQYLFSTTPYTLKDFEPMCEWQQHAPESGFNKRRICSRATDEGRVTLSDYKLIVSSPGHREEIILPSEKAVTAALEQHFAVDLTLI